MINSIYKIVLIVALVLSIVSMLLPWGEISFQGLGKMDIYSWGVSSQTNSIFTGSTQESGLYIFLFFNQNFMTMLSENQEMMGFIFPMIFGILVFPLLIVGIVFGSLYLLNKPQVGLKNFRDSGIFIFTSVIFFYIFIQFGLLSLLSYEISYLANLFSYSAGYYLTIFAGVLVLALFVIHTEFVKKRFDMGGSVKKDDDVVTLLKTRYVKGEISKDEYEQMKKEIED